MHDLTAQDYLKLIVMGLVKHPDEVSVTRSVDTMGVLLTLSVNSADLGCIIGREGKTATAIRTLVRHFGMLKHNERASIKILEE
jgi:predicted RNA-binding protein YlqC (UPF0109 family)